MTSVGNGTRTKFGSLSRSGNTMEIDLLGKVLSLYNANEWREALELSDVKASRGLLWVWPSENNLDFITSTVRNFHLNGVVSIGCGCGLFEWFLQQYSGFHVVGYEVNEKWWRSKYSRPQFIELKFPQQPPTPDILPPNYALLFCYFNDGAAFRDYISSYRGSLVFIVGPGPGAERYTDPQPHTPDFGSNKWVLHKIEEVRDSNDFVAAYVRVT